MKTLFITILAGLAVIEIAGRIEARRRARIRQLAGSGGGQFAGGCC